MKTLGLIAALLLAASPVAAQSVQQPLGAGGQTNTSSLPNTGVICIEEMTATFCNVPTSPSHGGYGLSSTSGSSSASGLSGTPGSRSGYGSSAGSGSSGGAGGAGTTASSTPPCSAFPPPNELCN
jgi:hypothetical protein